MDLSINTMEGNGQTFVHGFHLRGGYVERFQGKIYQVCNDDLSI